MSWAGLIVNFGKPPLPTNQGLDKDSVLCPSKPPRPPPAVFGAVNENSIVQNDDFFGNERRAKLVPFLGSIWKPLAKPRPPVALPLCIFLRVLIPVNHATCSLSSTFLLLMPIPLHGPTHIRFFPKEQERSFLAWTRPHVDCASPPSDLQIFARGTPDTPPLPIKLVTTTQCWPRRRRIRHRLLLKL